MRALPLLTSLLVFSLAPHAVAGKITVSPGGAVSTLQAALGQASAGDTIVMKEGVYQENCVVTPAKSGVTIKASGDVVLEARAAGGAAAGPGLVVLAADVTISGLTIRNAADDGGGGEGILVTADGVTVDGVTVSGCEEEGLKIAGQGATVTDCRFSGNTSALVINGNGATVTKVDVRNDEGGGIVVIGDDATIKSCSVANVQNGGGFGLSGERISIQKCTAMNVDEEGIVLTGTNATVKKNEVSFTRNDAIEVTGDFATVEKNEVGHVVGSGIVVDGSEFSIAKNDVRSVIGMGILIEDGITGGTVEGNDVSDGTVAGFATDASTDGIVFRDNKVTRFGGTGTGGFFIAGQNHTLDGNSAKECDDDGFYLGFDGGSVTDNTAKENGRDGFDFDNTGAADCVVTGNVAKDNGAEGFENNETDLTFTGNTAKNNRIDVANDGTFAAFANNTFTTGGQGTAPEVE